MPKPANTKPSMNLLVKNQVQQDTLEIQLLDYIYDWIDWDTWTYHDLVKETVNLINETKPKRIRLLIDSEGGDCGIGLALHNFLKRYRDKENAIIEVEILAMCGSIATVIASAASPGMLYIPKNAFFVIHRAWGYGYGNSEDLRHAADVIDLYTTTIVDIYVDRTGLPKEQIEDMIADGDKWMTGTEAVELGFCDAYTSSEQQVTIAARISKAPAFHAEYKHVPTALLKPKNTPDVQQEAQAAQQKPENGNNPGENSNQPGPAGDSSHKKGAFMNLKERALTFAANLKKKVINNKADNIAEEVANQMGEPLTEMLGGIQEEVNADITSLETKLQNAITALENRVQTLETANNDLQQENATLTQELADLKGSESGTKNEGGGGNNGNQSTTIHAGIRTFKKA